MKITALFAKKKQAEEIKTPKNPMKTDDDEYYGEGIDVHTLSWEQRDKMEASRRKFY